MRDTTLCYLVNEENNKITQICLAMKKRGFGEGRWNGAGGKVENESIEQALARETQEEIGVRIFNPAKVAELEFTFPHNAAWSQRVHVYFVRTWSGTPTESEEMSPRWFSVAEIPYNAMWPSDVHWLPIVLAGHVVAARFTFGENDKILDHHVETIPAT